MNNEREKRIVRQKLLDGSFLRISKQLLKTHDPALSVFVTILLECEVFSEQHGYIKPEGYFLCTRNFISDRVKLTPYQQKNITRNLEELGIADYKLIGRPAMGYFRLHHHKLNQILEA